MVDKQNNISSKRQLVLFIVPTFNEAENILPLVSTISAAFHNQTKYTPEILFVDDDSPDKTSDVIRALQTTVAVHLLNGKKVGLGAAYIRGMEYGLKIKPYDVIIQMDADLSHNPNDVPAMLAQIEAGADYVIGSRYIHGGRVANNYSVFRRLQSQVANYLAKKIVDLNADVKDMTSGFKAIRRSSLESIQLDNIIASSYVFQVNLLYEFDKHAFIIKETPITFWPRQRGQSKLGLRDITEFLWKIFYINPTSRFTRILRFGIVGAIGAIVNLITLTALVELAHFNVMIAYLIALETSIINNFFLNHRFTFKSSRISSKRSVGRQTSLIGKLLRYNLIAFGGTTIAWVTFMIAFRGLQIDYIVADILGILVATSWNYWLSVRMVWPTVLKSTPELSHEIQEI